MAALNKFEFFILKFSSFDTVRLERFKLIISRIFLKELPVNNRNAKWGNSLSEGLA